MTSTHPRDELLSRLAEYRELIEELIISRKDFGTPAKVDAPTRLHLREAFDSFCRAHCASESGNVSSQQWEAARAAIRTLLATSLYRAYWNMHREEFPHGFRKFIDALTAA